ncbi:hypothetical protein [Stomatohabitans albus]|uniref:hypothetical protein n=1 Tax=Stomatohabitans albus TaxID=3110766 RepID=UPI00300DA8A7
MSTQAEYEAAYFTLLRAREDLDHLHRYESILEEEQTRLTQWIAMLRDQSGSEVPPVIRRRLDDSVKPTIEAIQQRILLVQSELKSLPKRVEAQRVFVHECEIEVNALKP